MIVPYFHNFHMTNPGFKEGKHETMSRKSMRDQETLYTSKGGGGRNSQTKHGAEIRTAFPENMAAPMVLDHFDKSLQEFLKKGPVLRDIQRCMKELKTRAGDLDRKRLNLSIDKQKEAKKWKTIMKL